MLSRYVYDDLALLYVLFTNIAPNRTFADFPFLHANSVEPLYSSSAPVFSSSASFRIRAPPFSLLFFFPLFKSQ